MHRTHTAFFFMGPMESQVLLYKSCQSIGPSSRYYGHCSIVPLHKSTGRQFNAPKVCPGTDWVRYNVPIPTHATITEK